MFGWAGQILKVDLTKREIVKEAFDENFARSFLGGWGFNIKIMFDEFDPLEVKDPLDPRNIICVASGPLCGTPVGGASRVMVSVARSPAFRATGDGSAGGRFADALKYANYDAIVVKGKATDLVYLWIDDDHVELRDARHLKGKGVYETDRLLKEELRDRDIETMVIGPSGENLVHGAIPMVSRTRAPASGSTGTVFGSKNLKAIVVRGTKGVKVARPEELLRACEEVYQTGIKGLMFPKWSKRGSKWLTELTGPMSRRYNANWERPYPLDKVDSRIFTDKYMVPGRYKACDACYVHCDAMWSIKEGPYAGLTGRGLQHGNIRYFGYVPGVTDYDAILYLSHVAGDLGLDSTNTGEAIGAAFQLWEEGLLTAKDTGGLKLEWGNVSVVTELLNQIAHRQGFGGAWLADGPDGVTRKLAEMRGVPEEKGKEYFLQTKKKRDILVDPRALGGSAAFGFAIDVRTTDGGGVSPIWLKRPHDMETLRHIGVPEEIAAEFLKRGSANPAAPGGKGYSKVWFDDHSMAMNSLAICKRHTTWESMPFGIELVAKCFAAATGVDYSWKDLLKSAERIKNVQQAMNTRFGLRREDDILPDAWFEQPKPTEPGKGNVINRKQYEAALDEFYQLRGWDKNGVPTREKLEELGLQDVADTLEKSGILPKRAGKAGAGNKKA